MKTVKFYFKLESKGSLENVYFYPENEPSIIISTSAVKKEWENKSFELMVQNPFEYKLVVFGVSGTEWKAELKIIKDNEKVDFLSWEGTTGDTRRNISERKKPTKDV